MVFLKRLVAILFKLFVLLMVITFEKVVGLPLVFVALFLVFFINERGFYRYLHLVFGSIFLAVVYGISFSFSLLILVLLVSMVDYGRGVVVSDVSRVLISIYTVVLTVAVASVIVWSSEVVWSFVIGSLIMFVILMKTLFARRGLATESRDRKGSFFR